MTLHRAVALCVLALFTGLGCLGYVGLTSAKQTTASYRLLLEKELALRQVEVSIWEAANAVYYFVRDPSELPKQEYSKQLKDVEEYIKKCQTSITSERGKKALGEFLLRWGDCVARSDEIFRLRREQVSAGRHAWDRIHAADDVIDYQLQASFVNGVPQVIEREKAIREVEVSLWEALNATNYYSTQQLEVARTEYVAQLKDVEQFIAKFKALAPTPDETKHLNEFLLCWKAAKVSMNRTNEISVLLRAKQLGYWRSVHAADDVIDFKLQPSLNEERKDLDERAAAIPGDILLLTIGVLGASLSLLQVFERTPSKAI